MRSCSDFRLVVEERFSLLSPVFSRFLSSSLLVGHSVVFSSSWLLSPSLLSAFALSLSLRLCENFPATVLFSFLLFMSFFFFLFVFGLLSSLSLLLALSCFVLGKKISV